MSEPPFVEITLTQHPVQAGGLPACPAGGAEVIFLGRTRAEHHDVHGPLDHLDYEVHTPLATSTLQALATEAVERWTLHAVRIQHAAGKVGPRDASVCIEVLAGHRAEGFDACRWLIDALKAQVPIWKREVWADGTTWVDGTPVRREP